MAITTGTSTATTIDIATSTSPYATSTGSTLIAGIDTSTASTSLTSWTPDSGTDQNIIGPNDYVMALTNDAGLGGYTFGGTLTAVFMKP